MIHSNDEMGLVNADENLLDLIQDLISTDHRALSLPERNRHDSGHAFFQYPAMMVPAIQRTLINVVKASQPGIGNLLDPFVGAGTSLTAGMHHGLDVYGQDINPLAVLVAKVRTGPFCVEQLRYEASRTIATANADIRRDITVDFPNREKWFRDDVSLELSRLRYAIRECHDDWVRRFMWVTLAETIRLTSNDRTTTYKLHARPRTETQTRVLAPIDLFTQLIETNLRDLAEFKEELEKRQLVEDGHFVGTSLVSIGDTASSLRLVNHGVPEKYDLLMTSPPYGDNGSTITYGQHSYLPLQWIDLADIDPNVDSSCLHSTMAIDTNSIGGRRSRDLDYQVDFLRTLSPCLSTTLAALAGKPRDRISRVAGFYTDFVRSLDVIVPELRKNAYLVLTVGNRSVGGLEIPNDQILRELLEVKGVKFVVQLDRRIHHKRMPHRNTIARMMRTEKILVLRKQ